MRFPEIHIEVIRVYIPRVLPQIAQTLASSNSVGSITIIVFVVIVEIIVRVLAEEDGFALDKPFRLRVLKRSGVSTPLIVHLLPLPLMNRMKIEMKDIFSSFCTSNPNLQGEEELQY